MPIKHISGRVVAQSEAPATVRIKALGSGPILAKRPGHLSDVGKMVADLFRTENILFFHRLANASLMDQKRIHTDSTTTGGSAMGGASYEYI